MHNTNIVQPRNRTKTIHVGDVCVGGDAPVSVQTMCSTKTFHVKETLDQINAVAKLGCEIIRVTVPSLNDIDAFKEICLESPLPVVADIHFDHTIAIAAAQNGASALRINPGNIGSWDKVDAVIDAAGQNGIPIRIGVNAGSLDSEISAREELTLPQKLVKSCESFVSHFEDRGFTELVLSAKAHDVSHTLATYRELSQKLPLYPLHIGVTEAGTLRQGTIKNAAAVGILLEEGIGNTMRLSLTADPKEEIRVAWDLLSALNMRRRSPELISCPTCGRTEVDLISIANEVEKRLETVKAPITVAVMGCVVNGPGEASGADIGVACGRGRGVIFAHGEKIKTVDESLIVDALFDEIYSRWN